MYNINIKPVLNGWVAEVGCQTLVFNDMSVLLEELESYLKDPIGTENSYRENAVNCKITLGPVVGQPVYADPQPSTPEVGAEPPVYYDGNNERYPDHPYPTTAPSADPVVMIPAYEYEGLLREMEVLRAAASR